MRVLDPFLGRLGSFPKANLFFHGPRDGDSLESWAKPPAQTMGMGMPSILVFPQTPKRKNLVDRLNATCQASNREVFERRLPSILTSTHAICPGMSFGVNAGFSKFPPFYTQDLREEDAWSRLLI